MDPKTKNATQPFVYHTNKAVTKERESDFPSLCKASFFVSCFLDSLVNVFVAFIIPRRCVYHTKMHELTRNFISSCRHLLVLFFYISPFLQCDTSFRSSPSASASVDHKLSVNCCDSKTKTKTITTTTTATITTKTNTCDKSTTTKTTQTSGTMADGFVFNVSAESEEETSFIETPPRTTPLGTEIIHYRSDEAESGIDVRTAFPPCDDVEVADAVVTAYVGDGRLADVRRRVNAQLRADAIAASGALGFPLHESRVTKEARALEERAAKAPVVDLRQKLRGKRAAATGSPASLAASTEVPGASSSSSSVRARSSPATAHETGPTPSGEEGSEAVTGQRKKRGKRGPKSTPPEALTSVRPALTPSSDDIAVASSAVAVSSTPSADVLSERKQRRIEKARKRARKSASDRRRRKRNREALEKAQAKSPAAAPPSSSLIVTFTGEEGKTPSKAPASFGARDVRLIDAASSSASTSGPTPQAPSKRRITRPAVESRFQQGRQHRLSSVPSKPSSRGRRGRGSAPKGLREAQIAGIEAAREREAANPGAAAKVAERWAASLSSPSSSSVPVGSAASSSQAASSRPSGVITSPLDPDLRGLPPLVPIEPPSSSSALPLHHPPSAPPSTPSMEMLNAILAEQRRIQDSAQANVQQMLEAVLRAKKP